MKKVSFITKTALYWSITCIILIIIGSFGAFFFLIKHQQIDLSVLEQFNVGTPSIVLDDEGNEWARFQRDRREPILINKVPLHVIQAFVAAEDHSFWSHKGLSYKGMLRSFVTNCYYGKIVQGASTITQQLVKLLFFDSRKTIWRKIKEQIVALLVEQQCSKEQILQAYLNNVYFGAGIYGIEAACQRFWMQSVDTISLDQAAVLAAIVKSPSQYCPLLYPLSAKKRRDVVLYSMLKLGFIDQENYEQAKNSALSLVKESEEAFAAYAKEMIRQFLESLVGKEMIYGGGLIIKTTLNRTMQKEAEKHFSAHLIQLKKTLGSDVDGALLCMQSNTGEIKTLIGGFDFITSQFNRAIQAKRQFGSIFKPIIYAAAVQSGVNFAQTEIDEPLLFDQQGHSWQPHNYDHTFEGQMTLAHALAHSNNIVTIKTLQRIGADVVVNLAKKFHLEASLQPYLSLALGCLDGTLKEAMGMFNVFANNGIYVEPFLIHWVKNNVGSKIWKKRSTVERVLSSAVNDQVKRVLALGIDRIRARYTNNFFSEAIGKTGTTNDCRTSWFCGSTPNYTTAIYIGFDDNRSMGKHVYPATTSFPIWLQFNQQIAHPIKQFSIDPQLREHVIHCKTGLSCNKNDPEAISILV